MRILIFSWRDIKNPKSGGAEVLTYELAKRWAKSGHKVTIFSSRAQNLKERESFEGVRFIRRGGTFSCLFWGFFHYQKEFRGQFDLIIDQVHGVPFFANLYAQEKVIAFPHEVAAEIWSYEFPLPISLWGKILEKVYLALYKNVPFITVSPSTKKDLKLAGIKRIYLIPEGINLKPLSKVLPKEKQPTIISLGRLVRMKRVEETLKAFSLTCRTFPQALLWIVGQGNKSYLEKLKCQAKKLGLGKNVIFWGFVPERQKNELLKRAWLLVSTSVREGWGLAVIEAAACGTPSVVYQVPGLVDSVQNGKTGLISQGTPQNLAKNIQKLLLNQKLRLRLSQNALNYSRQFSWDKAAKKSLEVLSQITSGPRRTKKIFFPS